MYKILVTTRMVYSNYPSGAGCSIHTSVIEFATEAEANVAVDKINSQPQKEDVRQEALELY